MSKELGSTRLILRRDVGEDGARTAFTVVGGMVEGTELTRPAKRQMPFDALLER